MQKIALIGLLVFGGCSVSLPRKWCFDELNFCVMKTPRAMMAQACNRVSRWDSGKLLSAKDRSRIVGCFDPISRMIYVREDQPGVLLHELGHASGLSGEAAATIQWE